MSECKCSLRISLVGDGCRYCQPQTYIDQLEMAIDDYQRDIERLDDAQQWQPIETAPKDGTEVLLWRDSSVHMGHWNVQKYHSKPQPYWSDATESVMGVMWCREHTPPHWMPLPKPPEGA